MLSIFLLVLAAQFCAAVATAETLDQALAAAWNSNPNVAAARAGTAAARQTLRAAKGHRYPQLKLTGKLARQHVDGAISLAGPSRPIGARLDQAGVTLRAEQPVWTGGRTTARIAAAANALKSSQAQASASGADILLDAVAAYVNVMTARKLLQVQKKHVAVIRRQKQAAQAALDHGQGTTTDVAQAQARLQAGIARRIHAAAALHRARATYKTTVGHAPAHLSLPTQLPRLPASLAQAKQQAENNFRVRSARFKARSADASATLAGRALLPSVSLFAEARRAHEPQFGFDNLNDEVVGVSLSMPLWAGGTLRAKSAAARARAQQARLQMQAQANQSTSRVVAAWNNYAAARAARKKVAAQLAAARIAYRGVRAQHRHGQRTLLDVLNAEQAVRDAKASRIQARRQRIVAAYTLLAITGALTPQKLGLKMSKTSGGTP